MKKAHKEEWKDIPQFDGRYQASTLGRFRQGTSCHRSKKVHKIINDRPHNRGYRRIGLCRKDYLVHRLLAMTFIPNTENKPQIDHIDGDKTNNKLSNLRWVSQSENSQAGHSLGLWKQQTRNRKVKSELGVFKSIAEAARAVGVSPSSVSRNLLGTTNTAGGYKWQYIN